MEIQCNPEIRIVIAGSADAGKSTMIGVLNSQNTSGSLELDDGDGKARASITRHDHELKSRHTSSVTNVPIILNENKTLHKFTFVDLAGQQKYLKTTAFGIASQFPDFAFLLITAKKGILPMTKDHLNIIASLQLRLAIIVTKVDMIEDKKVIKENIQEVCRYIKRNHGKMTAVMRSNEDAIKFADLCSDNLVPCPVFKISSTTGKGYDILTTFMRSIKQMQPLVTVPKGSPRFYREGTNIPTEEACFYADNTFIRGGLAGVILSGYMRKGRISKGDKVYVGPFGKYGFYRHVQVLSIHDFERKDVTDIYAGDSGCVRIKSLNPKEILTRSMMRKGIKVLGTDTAPVWEFEATIDMFHHHTTFTPSKSQVIIHCMNVCQSASLYVPDDEKDKKAIVLRTGDKAKVRFKFLHKPEILEDGDSFVFREGNTQGCGVITAII